MASWMQADQDQEYPQIDGDIDASDDDEAQQLIWIQRARSALLFQHFRRLVQRHALVYPRH